MNKVNQETGELLDLGEIEPTRRQVVDLLKLYVENRKLEAAAATAKAQVGKVIRAYLDAHPGETVEDGEFGIVARIQERQTMDYDFSALSEADLYALATQGLLKADAAGMKALGGKTLATQHLLEHKIPGLTTALIVEERKF